MKEPIEYPHEHLWIGELGNVLILTAFVSVLLAAFSWFMAAREKSDSDSWRHLGRVSFTIHTITLIGAIAGCSS